MIPIVSCSQKSGGWGGGGGGGATPCIWWLNFLYVNYRKLVVARKSGRPDLTPPPPPMLYAPDKSIIQIYYTYVLSTTKTAENLLHIYNLKQN